MGQTWIKDLQGEGNGSEKGGVWEGRGEGWQTIHKGINNYTNMTEVVRK